MASALPAPARPGQLQVAGDSTALDVSRSAGPVVIQPGAGSLVHRSGRSIVVDNLFSEATESFHLFKAGQLGTLTLGKWRNTLRSQTVYLRKLLANIGTAQTTADAANFFRLKVTDAAAQIAVLPMTSAGANNYLLDQGYASVIDQGLTSHSGTGFGGVFNNNAASCFQFTVSATQTVTGVTVDQGLNPNIFGLGGFAGIPGNALPVHVAVLDASGNALAESTTTLAVGNAAAAFFPFTVSAQLKPGNTYYLAFDILASYPVVTGTNAATNTAALVCNISDTQVSAPNPGAINTASLAGKSVIIQPFQMPADPVARAAAIQALTWPAIIAGTAALPAWMSLGTGPVARNFSWKLQGSPSGLAVLNGDLTFSIDTVGAPVGTAVGADLNLHAVLSPS